MINYNDHERINMIKKGRQFFKEKGLPINECYSAKMYFVNGEMRFSLKEISLKKTKIMRSRRIKTNKN